MKCFQGCMQDRLTFNKRQAIILKAAEKKYGDGSVIVLLKKVHHSF
jgi:hypothetical protein